MNQEIRNIILKNVSPIKNIWSSKIDFSSLDKKFKDVRMILLGEPDHGAGTAFWLKSQFIKYLYEQHGLGKKLFQLDLHHLEGVITQN